MRNSFSASAPLLPISLIIAFACAVTSHSIALELDRIIVVVDEDVVMQSELDSQLRRVRDQLRQQGTALPPTSVLERQVIERLILQKIQLQIAARGGVEVTPERLEAAITSIAKKNNLSLQQFREILESDGIAFSEFEEQIRDEIMITTLRRQEVDRRVKVTEKEIDNYLSSTAAGGDSEEEYRIGHILISVPSGATDEEKAAAKEKAESVQARLKGGSDFGDMAVAVSDGQNALDRGDLGWRKMNEIPSLFEPSIRGMEVGEVSSLITSPSGYHIISLTDQRSGDQVLVEQHKARHILISPSELISDEEALNRIRQLKYRLEEGEDFAQIARQHSDDRGSALDGGNLGWVSKGQMVPEFEEVMIYSDVGVISHPFRSEFGWHILQVTERRTYDGTEEVKRQKARRAIGQRKKDDRLQTWLRRLRDEAYVEFRLDE
ncbi:MAG: peptidylprolyl isomerase [Gammaproteobacteria bacterium]